MSAPVEAQPTCALNAMQLVAEFDLFPYDPAHRFRFVIGHLPGESEKLSLCHRGMRILLGRKRFCQHLRRVAWLMIRHCYFDPGPPSTSITRVPTSVIFGSQPIGTASS
jgi:hypothetical protein